MALEERIKSLIAVGASVTANCQPCLDHHAKHAREIGANEEDIREAIEVAVMVRKGSAGKMDAAITALERG